MNHDSLGIDFGDETLPSCSPQAVFPPPIRLHSPTHLSSLDFGSKFILHSTTQMNCIYPLFDDRFVLLGTITGLSVLITAPSLSGVSAQAASANPLQDAIVLPIWTGLPVWSMQAVDSSVSSSAPDDVHGCLSMLVGAGKDQGPTKSGDLIDLRVYRLASLASLARWVGVRSHESSAMVMPAVEDSDAKSKGKANSTSHYRSKSSISSLRSLLKPTASRPASPEEEKPDDLSRQWASDWLSLSLQQHGVVVVDCHSIPINPRVPRLGNRTLIALVTKTDAHLYSTTTPSDGELYHFTIVKSCYLPASPKHATFVTLDESHTRDNAGSNQLHRRSHDEYARTDTTSLGLYISFGGKACIIRISDAVVFEVEMPSTTKTNRRETLSEVVDAVQAIASRSGTRTPSQFVKAAIDGRDEFWGELHVVLGAGCTNLYSVTKGKRTAIIKDPIAFKAGHLVEVGSIRWQAAPLRTHIISRVSDIAPFSTTTTLLASFDDSLAVKKVDLAELLSSGSAPESSADVAISGARFLLKGGRWQSTHPFGPSYTAPQWAELMSSSHASESESESQHPQPVSSATGVYISSKWGPNDWRISWLGPT